MKRNQCITLRRLRFSTSYRPLRRRHYETGPMCPPNHVHVTGNNLVLHKALVRVCVLYTGATGAQPAGSLGH